MIVQPRDHDRRSVLEPALADGEIDIALVLAVDGDDSVDHDHHARPVRHRGQRARSASCSQVMHGRARPGRAADRAGNDLRVGEGDFFNSFAPALVGFVVFFLVFILTGISFLRERIGGTLERLLATPVRRLEIVLGYSLGFAIFATLQVAIVLLFVLGSLHIEPIGPLPDINLGLGVPIAGSPLLAFVITLLLALCAVNLGIFLSTFARTEFQILQFIPLVIVPQALLSGIYLAGRVAARNTAADRPRDAHDLRHRRTARGAHQGLRPCRSDRDPRPLGPRRDRRVFLAVAATLTIRREVA